MVINHLEKLFVTSDAATIVRELEIQHPAARLIVLAAQAQEQEIGDATNFVSQVSSYIAGSRQYHVALLPDYTTCCRFLHLLANC